jgi:hypothetical protein
VLKINWFSPLPPARSGIAQNFAMQLLPALARHHEMVLWTDQDQVAPEVQSMARVARYDPAAPPWREINDGTISIYHLGNQPDLHGGIWQVSVRQPGIVVLHDLCLHDFFLHVLGPLPEGSRQLSCRAGAMVWRGRLARRGGIL